MKRERLSVEEMNAYDRNLDGLLDWQDRQRAKAKRMDGARVALLDICQILLHGEGYAVEVLLHATLDTYMVQLDRREEDERGLVGVSRTLVVIPEDLTQLAEKDARAFARNLRLLLESWLPRRHTVRFGAELSGR